MTRCAVLVRGVNVGGHNRLPMPVLREVLAGLGATDVTTYVQSGNAVVTADADGLGPGVERGLRERLGLDVRVLVRTRAELAAVVEANPFPEREATPKQLHVHFLDRQLSDEEAERVRGRHGDDEIAVGARVLYLSYAEGSYRSPTEKVLRGLEVVLTARNWSTVTKLLELCDDR